MSRAAVLVGIDQPLEIRDDIVVDAPRAHELKIRMAASGVCHTDLSAQNGTLYMPTPCVLGHEGAGVVEALGPGVDGFAVGDHVVISWVPQCGTCYFCTRHQPHLCETALVALASGGLLDGTTRLTSGGEALHQMVSSGTFGEVAIVPDTGAVKIPHDLDLTLAALLGCGVLTGVGAALNTARIASGDTVVVVGCGGVGLNVVQGARIAGAGQIIAVDTTESKRQLASVFGATTTIDPGDGDPVARIAELTSGRGADVVFEVVGVQPTIEQAIAMTRRGGQTILVGVPNPEVHVHVPAAYGIVLTEKTVKGCVYGSADVRRDVPRMIELYRTGELKLDELVSRTIGLDQVNDAFAAIESGDVARSVILYPV